jgi:type II secretory pathway pseudopilin PulG
MLNVINTKSLVAILAALGIIGTLLIRERRASEKAASEAAKTASILQQQELDRKTKDEAAQRENDELRRTIEREHKRHANDNKNPSKTWQTYVP